MTKQQIRHFYAGGITSQGFVHYYDSSLQQLQRVFILKGGPGTGKSTLIQTVSDWLAADVTEQWHLHAAKDPGTLDGVVIPGVAAVVAGDAPHVVEPKLPGAVEQIVYFGTAWATHQLVAQKNRIAAMQAKVDQAYDEVFRYFQTALRVHDDW